MGSFNGGIVHAALIDVARPTQMCVTPSGSSPDTKRYGFPSCHWVGLCCWWLFLHQRQSQSSQASITDQGPALARNCQIGSTCQELPDWQCQTLSFTDEATTGVLASRVWFNCYYYFSISWIIQLYVCISVCVYIYIFYQFYSSWDPWKITFCRNWLPTSSHQKFMCDLF